MILIPKGYNGKILWVNLSSNEIKEEKLDENIYKQYLGGYGLGVYIIFSRIKTRCDALGPENILGFCPGLLTGNPVPFTGRYMVCGKSPLTGKVLKEEPIQKTRLDSLKSEGISRGSVKYFQLESAPPETEFPQGTMLELAEAYYQVALWTSVDDEKLESLKQLRLLNERADSLLSPKIQRYISTLEDLIN